MLTKKQHQLLMFIHDRLQDAGVPPSFDEMKEALELRSKSGIHRLITALEERGFIRRLPHRARALEVVKLPGSVEEKKPKPKRGFTPNVIQGAMGRAPDVIRGEPPEEYITIPVMGRIAAGVPASAIQTLSHTMKLPADMLSAGEHFALEVRGDSMAGAGIIEGDIVIVRRTDTAENGDIVVALVDDEEATLKKLRRKGGSIALEAANPKFETRIFGPDRVRIQGRLITLIRRY